MEYRAELRQARDGAQKRLTDAVDVRDQAAVVYADALKAEEKTVKPLADALAAHGRAEKAEETARRLRKAAEEQIEADARLQAAARVLARFQAEAAAAVRAREAAEVAAARAEDLVRTREAERDQAQLVLGRHATVPLSRETVFTLLFPALRMALGQDAEGRALEQAERGMVGVFGDALRGAAFSEFAGAWAKADEERIRAQLADELKHAPHLRNVGTGHLEASWVNPPKPCGGMPAGAVVTPAPSLSPAGPLGRPAGGVLPGPG